MRSLIVGSWKAGNSAWLNTSPTPSPTLNTTSIDDTGYSWTISFGRDMASFTASIAWLADRFLSRVTIGQSPIVWDVRCKWSDPRASNSRGRRACARSSQISARKFVGLDVVARSPAPRTGESRVFGTWLAAKHQAEHNSRQDSGAEANGYRLHRALLDHSFRLFIALLHRLGGLLRRLLDLAGCLLGVFAGCLYRLGDTRAAIGSEFFEVMFDRTAGFTRFSLNQANEAIYIAVERLQFVVGELAPFAAKLAFDFIPIALEGLLVDH